MAIPFDSTSVIHEPMVVVIVFFLMSLGSSFVLFKFLKNTAHIKTTYGSFGGAIAGFIGIFVLLAYTYNGIQRQSNEPRFNIPQGFKRFVSRDYKIGFGYPDSLSIFQSQVPVQIVMGKFTEPYEGGFSIAVQPLKADISDVLKEPASMCGQITKGWGGMIPGMRCLSAKEYSVSGLSGVLIEYVNEKGGPNEAGTKGYTLGIPHPTQNLTYYITASSPPGEIDKTRIVLERILSTVSFIE